MSRIVAEVDEGIYIEPSNQTLSEWLDLWLDTYVAFSVKPYTVDSYRSVCKNHIKPVLGKVKLSQLSAPQIQQLYNTLLKDGLSPKSIKNVHGVLHKALNQAIKIGILRYNPTDACDLPKVYNKEIKPLEHDEITAFLKAITGHRFECLYQVTLFTGLRQGEALGLTWDCVDFQNNTLYINKQLQKSQKVGGEYRLVPTKNSRARLITVAPTVMVAGILPISPCTRSSKRSSAPWDWILRDIMIYAIHMRLPPLRAVTTLRRCRKTWATPPPPLP